MDIKNKLNEELNKNILYTAVVLTEKSRGILLSKLGSYIPEGWKTIAHHMTITFGKPLSDLGLELYNGVEVDLRVVALGKSDKAIAAKVEGFKTKNKIPHITLAINVENGGKPVDSNKITDWEPIDINLGTIIISGIVTEFYK